MKSKNYYRVRRGVRLIFWGAFLAGIYYVATHLNWTGEDYCWGSMAECYLEGK